MKRRDVVNWDEHGHLVNRSSDGTEYYNYPSPLAQRLWHYVLCLGRANMAEGYHYVPTKRNGFLLHYIRRGEVEHTVRGARYRVGKGAVCLMDLSEELLVENKSRLPAENWWVLFNGRDLPHLFTELRADRNPVFSGLDVERFEPLYRELLELTKSRPAAYEPRSSALLAGILAELFAARATRQTQVALMGRKDVLSEPVRRGIDYMIRFHSESALGLKRICEAAGLSLHHFVRLFRREMGVSPIQYLNRYRVEQAKSLLTESDKTMEKIARQIGASSQNYFSYLFRKTTGMTPREYRSRAARIGKEER